MSFRGACAAPLDALSPRRRNRVGGMPRRRGQGQQGRTPSVLAAEIVGMLTLPVAPPRLLPGSSSGRCAAKPPCEGHRYGNRTETAGKTRGYRIRWRPAPCADLPASASQRRGITGESALPRRKKGDFPDRTSTPSIAQLGPRLSPGERASSLRAVGPANSGHHEMKEKNRAQSSGFARARRYTGGTIRGSTIRHLCSALRPDRMGWSTSSPPT